MRHLLLSFLLGFPALASAQELHTFSNGEVADAEKINSNFSTLVSQIDSISDSTATNCSVTQQNNTAVIECPDGTRAAIAGEGSVVVFPDGILGTLPVIDVNSGEVVVIDANDLTLGEAEDISTSGYSFRMEVLAEDRDFSISIRNNLAEQTVDVSAVTSYTLYYTDENCTNGPFGSGSPLYDIDGTFMVSGGDNLGKLLFQSQRESAYISSYNDTKFETTDCVARDEIRSFNYALTKYTVAEEILNAGYPVRVEQLP